MYGRYLPRDELGPGGTGYVMSTVVVAAVMVILMARTVFF